MSDVIRGNKRGVEIILTGDEVAMAIEAYLIAHNVRIHGPRTISLNGEGCDGANIYVDPTGFVLEGGIKWSMRQGEVGK